MATATKLPMPPLRALLEMAKKKKGAKFARGKQLGASMMRARKGPPTQDEGPDENACADCGAELTPNAKFCDQCGAPASAPVRGKGKIPMMTGM
jgi:ribosomal protein L40E